MTAPGIVLVAPHSGEAEAISCYERITRRLQQQRPDLTVNLGLIGDKDRCVEAATQDAINAGHREIALCPMTLMAATAANRELEELCQNLRTCTGMRITCARPIGPAAELLNIMDSKVREALQRTKAIEVDALVLATPPATDTRGSSLLARRARQWSTHHKLPVQLAVADESGTPTAAAITALRSHGRRHIAVGSHFLTTGPLFRAHANAAQRSGAIAVAAPIDADPQLVTIILARYAFAAMELLELEDALEALGDAVAS